MSVLLGIDLGTSSVKAVLFDPHAREIVAVAAREYPILKPAPDRAEQDPNDWWQATIHVVREALATAGQNVDNLDVIAIGFSAQMHATVLLDAENRLLHPAIIWPDQRSVVEVRDLINATGEAQYAAVAGTLPATGFTGPTLLWLKRHAPDLLSRTARVILVKDYVRLMMTGNAATDVTDAAATGIFDVAHKRWANELIQPFDLPPSILAPVLDSAEVAGELTPAAASLLGLKPGIPVVAGCADQPAQAIGNGIIAPGAASVTTGSGGQVFVPVRACDGRLATDPRLHVFNHAIPDLWYVLGAILAAGLGLRWLRGVTALDGDPNAYPQMSVDADRVPPGADGLIYLPYLSGERTPHMDPLARGAFIGLNYHHGRGHMARAVMEGVAFALRQALELSLQLGGTVERVIAAGGGAESAVWRQIQADVFGLPLQQTLLREQAGVGAALLAGVGAGVYRDLNEACAQVVQYGPITEPDAARHRFYDDVYAQYVGLYPTLRDDFHRLSQRG